jgi:hypothetical protein
MFLFLTACFHKAPVVDSNLKPVAEETMNVAHPTATLLDYSIVATEKSSSKGRYTDVQMRYQPLFQDPAMLTVRYYVLSTEPCRIDVELLSDTGLIPPILLNEWASESSLSALVCETQSK